MTRKRPSSIAWSNLWWSLAVNTVFGAIICGAIGFLFGVRRTLFYWRWPNEEDLPLVVIVTAAAGALLTALLTLRAEWPRPAPPDPRRYCRKCGYDLIGHADHGKDARSITCPECGWSRREPAVDAAAPEKESGPYGILDPDGDGESETD